MYVVNTNINRNMEKYCLNCGHDCHCGGDCIKEYDKGNKIVCCGHCRCDKKENTTTNKNSPSPLTKPFINQYYKI